MLNALPRSEPNNIGIIYEDDSLLVVNKPAGLVTLRTSSYRGKTLQDWVEERLEIRIGGRAGIAHRLDKETWGIILIAKNQSVFKELQNQFKERRVTKKYFVLVRGIIPSKGRIVAPLGRSPGNNLKFGVIPGGKRAETEYEVIDRVKINGEDFDLVEVKLKTGRTHQIRVHFKYLGHSVFGDGVYGGRRERGKPMFLVAKEIEFFHPVKKKMVKFTIGLPDLLKSIISRNEKK